MRGFFTGLGGNLRPPGGIGRQDTVLAMAVNPRWRDQGSESLEQLQRREVQRCAPVRVRYSAVRPSGKGITLTCSRFIGFSMLYGPLR